MLACSVSIGAKALNTNLRTTATCFPSPPAYAPRPSATGISFYSCDTFYFFFRTPSRQISRKFYEIFRLAKLCTCTWPAGPNGLPSHHMRR